MAYNKCELSLIQSLGRSHRYFHLLLYMPGHLHDDVGHQSQEPRSVFHWYIPLFRTQIDRDLIMRLFDRVHYDVGNRADEIGPDLFLLFVEINRHLSSHFIQESKYRFCYHIFSE